MVSFNLKVLAKFGFCSNCSQKLDECSLARARKNRPSEPVRAVRPELVRSQKPPLNKASVALKIF